MATPTIANRTATIVSIVKSPSAAPLTIHSTMPLNKQVNSRLIPKQIKAVLFNFCPAKSVCHKIESTRKKESIIHINIASDKLRTPTGRPEDRIMMSRAGLSEIFIP